MPKKQTEIPGTERAVIEPIEEAAAAYVEVRDQRMALAKEEKQKKEELRQAVIDNQDQLEDHAKGGKVYKYYDGEKPTEVRYDVQEKEILTVRVAKDEEEDADVIEIVDDQVAVG